MTATQTKRDHLKISKTNTCKYFNTFTEYLKYQYKKSIQLFTPN